MNACIPLCAMALLALPCLPTQASDAQEEANKKIVLDFYDKAINQKDFEAASVHLGDKYIQHNPLAADGPEGLKTFLAFAKQNIPDFRIEFKRVFADGDHVIVHGHARAKPNDPTDRGSAVMDIFRLENGKVVEHWDVSQPVPEKPNNANTMF
jgi:predicted SnoaL-like aldol condensation-catalyzing enzyme